MNSEQIVAKIDELRKLKGWSVYELAKRTGLTENALYNWKRRDSGPSVKTLQNICDVFNISLADFFANENFVQLTPNLKNLVDNYRLLSSTQQDAVLYMIKGYLQ